MTVALGSEGQGLKPTPQLVAAPEHVEDVMLAARQRVDLIELLRAVDRIRSSGCTMVAGEAVPAAAQSSNPKETEHDVKSTHALSSLFPHLESKIAC